MIRRVHQTDQVFSNKKVDVGAEFVHGVSTSLNKLAKENDLSMKEIFTWAQVMYICRLGTRKKYSDDQSYYKSNH